MKKNSCLSYLISLFFFSYSPEVKGQEIQVIPDNSLGSTVESQIRGDNLIIRIQDGTIRGNNLFHSFEEFSINENQVVNFVRQPNISNIFSRVTGDSISEIDGTLRSLSNANLFFMNPNGIVFGKNAKLDISGSFFATTVDKIHFDDGTEFLANINDGQKPLLTINQPVGIGFDGNQGDISINNNNRGNAPDNFDNPEPNLKLRGKDKTLALIGGNINIDNSELGTLQIRTGKLILGSVSGNSRVDIKEEIDGVWNFNYDNVDSFKDIILSNNSIIQSTSINQEDGGNIEVTAKNLTLQDGSFLNTSTLEMGDGGKIKVTTSESIIIKGYHLDEKDEIINSGIFSKVLINGVKLENIINRGEDPNNQFTGNGGNIDINTKNLIVRDGGLISTSNFNQGGNGGNITIDTDSIIISGIASIEGLKEIPSGLFSSSQEETDQIISFRQGNAGNINITTNSLTIEEGGEINLTTREEGNGGTLTIETDKLTINNRGKITTASLLGENENQNNLDSGDSGELNINAKSSIDVSENSSIETLSESTGNAGNVNINTPQLTISNSNVDASTTGEGKGGELTINTENLTVEQGAKITASASGSGNGGILKINDEESINVSESLINVSGENSSIESKTESTGNAGNLTIETDKLIVNDGGKITTASLLGENENNIDRGDGGKLNITANSSIDVSENSSIETLSESTGNAGNVNINTPQLTISNSNVDASTTGEGKGGELTINTENLTVEQGAKITASASGSGNGGILKINDEESINVSESLINVSGENSSIESKTESTGNAGNLTIETDKLIVNDGGKITTASLLGENENNIDSGDGGELNITANSSIDVNENSSIDTLSESTGNAGNININTKKLTISNSDIDSSTTGEGTGGTLTIETDKLTINDRGKITTASLLGENQNNFDRGNGGTLKIDANSSIDVNENSSIESKTESTGIAGDVNINTPQLTISNSNVDASTTGTGTGGTLTIETDKLTINNRGKITTASLLGENQNNFDRGNGGTLKIDANSSIDVNENSSIESKTESTGIAGNVNINTPQLTISNSNVNASTTGTGNGGTLTIETDNLTINNRGKITTASLLGENQNNFDRGNGGELNINANSSIDVNENSSIESKTESTGIAGNVNINTLQLTILNSSIDVSSTEKGQAGDLTIESQNIILDNKATDREATISAETAKVKGGNIKITIDNDLILRSNSTISAKATGEADGGNVNINADFIIAFPGNNDILASAQQGKGGEITINGVSIFGIAERNPINNFTNDINASSEFGTSGTVKIEILDDGSDRRLFKATNIPIDIKNLLATNLCNLGEEKFSYFINSGRGGIAPNPYEPLDSSEIFVDTQLPTKWQENSVTNSSNSKPIVEARNWFINEKGNLELVSQIPSNVVKCNK